VWSDSTLDAWLTDTWKLVPNNDMTFHVEKAGERREIIAYLKQWLSLPATVRERVLSDPNQPLGPLRCGIFSFP
jgi:hypothetical protein